MKKALTILIGFIHDFAAGCWAATMLAVYRLDTVIHVQNSNEVLISLQKEFFYIGIASIAVVLLAGGGRTFTYAHVGNVYGDSAERLRRRMLIVKHVLLFLVFGAGTYWQYVMTFK